jgi:hypothetical protein
LAKITEDMHKIGEKMDEHSNEVSKKLVELQEEMK